MGKRGRQSGIRYGQKKQQGQSDTEQLIAIKQYLKKRYKIQAKREPYLLFENERLVRISDYVRKDDLEVHLVKNPDLLWIDKYGMWIIEVDGDVHLRYMEKTLKRNELFIKNHINLIVVPLYELCKNVNIYDFIDEKIQEIIEG